MKKTISLLRRVLSETFWIALTLVVVVGGYQAFRYLERNRAEVEVTPIERPVGVVETRAAEAWTAPVPVRAEGFVRPLRSVPLSARSGGRVAWLHPAIIERKGTFKAGDVLVRLDDSAERASLRQTNANIVAARAQLGLERSRRARAAALFDRGASTRQALDEAEARFADAEARLDGLRAAAEVVEVSLDSKVVRAPFDGAVLSKSVEVGSVVGPGEPVAQAFSAGRMVVDVNLRETEAALIPRLFEGAPARARVQIDFAGSPYMTGATVTRVAPELDPKTRTLAVTVELDAPGGLRLQAGQPAMEGAPPALVNAYAKVVIDGLTGDTIFRVPSTALHAGAVWLLVDGALRVAPARILELDESHTFIDLRDIGADARLITSTIPAPVDGMALRDLTSSGGSVSGGPLSGGPLSRGPVSQAALTVKE